jgi:outer membrane lipase/esterase
MLSFSLGRQERPRDHNRINEGGDFVKKMHRLQSMAGAVLLACTAPGFAAGYSNLYVFGDSLSDSGAFTNLVGPGANKFTNNPGTVWSENLGSRYGIAVAPGFSLNPATAQFSATGGNNYAIGGARVAGTPGVFSLPAPYDALGNAIAANIVPVATQINTNLQQTGGTASPSALYAIWAGANDVFYQADIVGATGPSAIPAASNAIIAAGTAEIAQIATLRNAGASHIVVVALPDMGLTPFGAQNPTTTGALLSQLSAGYNTVLTQGLTSIGITNIAFFDPRPLFADIVARPAAWGVTNVSVPACGANESLGCGPAQQIPGSANFLFADGVHPTAYAHRIISDWIYSTLEAPGRLSAMTQLPMASLDGQWRAIDTRLQASAAPGLHAFAYADYAPSRYDGSAVLPWTSGHAKSVTVGVEKRWQQAAAGVALGYADAGYDLDHGAGKIDFTQTSLSAFGRLNIDAAHFDGTFSMASLNFDTRRNFGPLNNPGSAGGQQWGFKLGAGYDLTTGQFVHGPVAALLWQKASVDSFAESGPVAMAFGSQARESLRHRLGWQASWTLPMAGANVSPYVRLTHEKEYKERQGSLSAGFVNSPFQFDTPLANDTRGYGLLAVGANFQMAKLGASIGATSTLGQSGQRQQSVSLGINLPF